MKTLLCILALLMLATCDDSCGERKFCKEYCALKLGKQVEVMSGEEITHSANACVCKVAVRLPGHDTPEKPMPPSSRPNR